VQRDKDCTFFSDRSDIISHAKKEVCKWNKEKKRLLPVYRSCKYSWDKHGCKHLCGLCDRLLVTGQAPGYIAVVYDYIYDCRYCSRFLTTVQDSQKGRAERRWGIEALKRKVGALCPCPEMN